MNLYRTTTLLLLAATAFFNGTFASGQVKLSGQQEAFFESKIRPALIKYCYECHSIDSGMTRGGLLVDTRDGLLQGGESGPAIDLQSRDDSPLWTAINYEDYEMPPGQPMPQNVIDDFEKWFEMGLPDPRIREKITVTTSIDIESGKSHWAYQKPIADVTDTIDAAVSQKQNEIGTTPVSAANPATLLRRLNFDLIGLPPSVSEIADFCKAFEKDSENAVAQKIDQLLDRPQFGERWGRHWMDVARFAESSGNGNFTYPHAWRYRDYVIDAFNKDLPYDQFIQQQLAGDLLPAKTDRQWQENLIATGFLAVGIKDHGERNPRIFQMELVDEQIDTTTQAFLGMTVSCARCHDHKFDPIPTVDYYSMAGIFMSTDTLYGTVFGQQNHQPTKLLELPILDSVSTTKSMSSREIEQVKQRLDEIRNQMRMIRNETNKPGGKRPDQRQMVALRNQIARLEGQLKTVDQNGKPFTFGMGVQDSVAVDAHVLLNGDVEKKAQTVERGFLQVLNDVPSQPIPSNSSGRRQLAQWIGSKENPLTARVMVNRIWMHLTGTPLMESPNNFGVSAQPPVNPELLDLLAVKLMDYDWSIKSMIREIVLSDTYQRSSAFDKRNFKIDPENKTFWRSNSRQLDAESLRDAMLAASSLLKTEAPLASEVAGVGDGRMGRLFDKDAFDSLNFNRSVYLPIVRDSLPDALALFDFADPNATQGRRDATNVPSQSLYLMNSDYVTFVAQKMAIDLTNEQNSTIDQVRMAYLRMFGRPATETEMQLADQFFRIFKVNSSASVDSADRPNDFAKRRGRNQLNTEQRNAKRISEAANRQRRQSFKKRAMQMADNQNIALENRRRNRNMQRGGPREGFSTQGTPGVKPNNSMQQFPRTTGNGRGRRSGKQRQEIPKLKLTPEQKTLAIFCQSLIASAEFRILD